MLHTYPHNIILAGYTYYRINEEYYNKSEHPLRLTYFLIIKDCLKFISIKCIRVEISAQPYFLF
jgi:hypothetical protein